jgi:hypothetical protein
MKGLHVSTEMESTWIEAVVAKLEILGSFPYTGLGRPLRLQMVEVPRVSIDNRHAKVAKLSALRTGRLYPPGDQLS